MISQLLALSVVAASAMQSVPMPRDAATPAVIDVQPPFALPGIAEGGEVSVVLVEQLGAPQIAAVVRRTKGDAGKDLLVIKSSALTPELLVAGLKTAARSIKKQEHHDQLISIWILEKQHLPQLSTAQMEWARSTIVKLRQAPAELADAKLGQRATLHVSLKDVP